MASSKCVNCGFEYFEVVKNKPLHSDVDLLFVQCLSCGSVLGLVNESDTALVTKLIETQYARMEEIAKTLDHNIRLIAGKIGVK